MIVCVNQDSESFTVLDSYFKGNRLEQLAVTALVFYAKAGHRLLTLTEMSQDMQVVRAFYNQKTLGKFPT